MYEIERKFLVDKSRLKLPKKFKSIEQGYIMRAEGRSLRVRKVDGGYILTLKIGKGARRVEIERPLDKAEGAALMLRTLDPVIVKKRYAVKHKGHVWDVDVFKGENKGLVLAEVELDDEDEKFDRPDWVTREVTGDQLFQNSTLATHPISMWREAFDEFCQPQEAMAD
ncbi:CYTH domain-containing protein [Kordiimonas gwangyangensis]|uniref:CYTH domain-containing protein n=1 Tax=Kordiimonas gwangyangensis TaxID=288022 RepID=UPI00036635E8|nr:CYTH domain-containing protein [Kordiimonas gwangyangensis]